MDTLLLTFFTTADESCADETLEELIQIHVAPIARLILRGKLGLYVSGLGENPSDPNAEDLYQEILVRVVQGLRRKKLSDRDVDIENFHAAPFPDIGREFTEPIVAAYAAIPVK